jgi:hypothetical protein
VLRGSQTLFDSEGIHPPMSNNRVWFDAGGIKDRLEEKVRQGWYVHWSESTGENQHPQHHVGQVLRLVYAGYKVRHPDGSEIIINPERYLVEDFDNVEIFESAASAWQEQADLLCCERTRLQAEAQATAEARLSLQAQCKHYHVQENCVLSVAGCDITDTHCLDCDKGLRRSWSTASDRDPNDHITDWTWWTRYCMTHYQQSPKPADYEVVDSLDAGFRR